MIFAATESEMQFKGLQYPSSTEKLIAHWKAKCFIRVARKKK